MYVGAVAERIYYDLQIVGLAVCLWAYLIVNAPTQWYYRKYNYIHILVLQPYLQTSSLIYDLLASARDFFRVKFDILSHGNRTFFRDKKYPMY